MKKIKILLIEDNRLLRDGIVVMLKKQPDMQVIASVGNGENILQMMGELKPDIILLDLGLRHQNSLQVVKLVNKNFKGTKIIVMDLVPLQSDVLEFVRAGVSGFILKDANIAEFFKTIRSVYEGNQVLPPHLTGSLFSQIVDYAVSDAKPAAIAESVRMTKRERQVIELISDGSSNKEIAIALHISTYTAKSHVHNILEKLALNTRLQIAKHAHLSTSNKDDIEDATLSIE
jgi:DNA-binding NarL/FixJ family response regulator